MLTTTCVCNLRLQLATNVPQRHVYSEDYARNQKLRSVPVASPAKWDAGAAVFSRHLVSIAIAIIGFEAKGTDPTPSRLTPPRLTLLPGLVPVRAERPQVQDIAEKLRETRDRISDLMVRL